MKQGEWFLSFRLRKTFVKEFFFICFVDMYVMLLWGCAWGHNPYRGQKLLFQSGFSPTKCGSLNCTWFVKLREKSLYVLRHLPTTRNYCQLSELRTQCNSHPADTEEATPDWAHTPSIPAVQLGKCDPDFMYVIFLLSFFQNRGSLYTDFKLVLNLQKYWKNNRYNPPTSFT